MLYSVYLKAQSKLSLSEGEVREGLHCAVQLPGQPDWYRAQLITDLGSGQLKVFLHDFGGYYTVTLTSLRWLLRKVVHGRNFRERICLLIPIGLPIDHSPTELQLLHKQLLTKKFILKSCPNN